MSFDPTKPAPGDDLDAVLIRNQLNELKALIDAEAFFQRDEHAKVAKFCARCRAV